MKNLKRALFLLLVLAIGMPTVALAAYESMSEAFDNKIVKISLENGYNLLANGCIYDADPEDAIYDMVDAEGDTVGASEEGIPVYDVNVPAGTEYVYMYTWQDPDNNGAFAHSYNGNYSVGTATVTLSDGMDCVFDGSGYNVWTNIAQYSDDMSTVNLWVTDANGEDPYEQTIAKVKIPVAMQLEDASDEESENYGKSRVVVFNQQDNNYPLALCFHETAMDVSNVPAEDVQLSMAESFTWSVDPANIVSKTPDLRVHPIGANNITDVTWESSDSSIVSVENVSAPGTINEEYDSCTISTAELVPHKTGVVTITVKGGDYEKSTTITVTANNCTHTDTAETIEQVEGEQKHNVITACAFCGEQVGDVTTENCADGNADGACDLCGGEVKAEAPEVNTPAISVPDGAPFSAITTDKGGAISVVEAGELTVDPWGMGFGYTGTVYHVVIPEGASSADITLDMPFSQLMYYMDNAGKPTTIAGYTGNAVYDNDECLEPGQDGGTASFAFTAPDNNSTVITVQMELRGGKSLVKPADFDPDSSSAYYAAGPEYGDANANAYNPVCYFTFEYGSAAGGEEPECDHAETTTAYVQVEGTETHTVTVTCTCGEVISTETADCVDEDKNGACDMCGGEVVVEVIYYPTSVGTRIDFDSEKTSSIVPYSKKNEDASAEYVYVVNAENKGMTLQSAATVFCKDNAETGLATDQSVVWSSSSDAAIASITGDGVITWNGGYGLFKVTCKSAKNANGGAKGGNLKVYFTPGEVDGVSMQVYSNGSEVAQTENVLTLKNGTVVNAYVIEDGKDFELKAITSGSEEMAQFATWTVKSASSKSDTFAGFSGLNNSVGAVLKVPYETYSTKVNASINYPYFEVSIKVPTVAGGTSTVKTDTMYIYIVAPGCDHVGTETTTAYDQVEGTETHTVTVTCVCGEVISTETVACADADKNGKCDQCEGAVKVEEPAVPINKLTFWVNEIKVTEVSMKVGETVDAIAGCTPKATTENIVLFSSSNSEVLSVSDEEVTADGTYGHAKTTIKGEKVGEAILTAVSKTNSDVSAQLKVTVTCNHVGTETTSSCEYEGVGGGVHNTVTSVYCACGEFIGKSTSLNDVCVDENTDSKCDLCGGEVDVPVVTGPVAIYDSSKDGAWSTRIKISKLFVEGVTVKSYQWTGNACVVTLAADTPADAQVTFSYEGLSGGGGGGAVYINGSKSTRTIPLVIGEQVQVTTASSVYIGSMRDDKSVIFQLEGTEQIPVERIEINAGDGRVVAGGTKQLTATVYPENATIKDVKWSTSAATTNLTITESGKVTGQSMGMGGYYTVTATSVSNPEISASCKVFLDWKPETSIALDKETMTVKIGQPVRLTATISGTQFVTNTTATWTSSDESIATVDGGKVTGLKTGTVTITATSYYGLTATCEVTVECPHIGMETATAYEHIDGTETHTAVNTCVCGYMLGSSTEDCADENADGKCDKCEGDVALPVYTIELDKSEASVWAFGDQQIPTGYEAYAADFPKTAELKATVKVNDVETDAAEVVWTSSDDKVATVENGVVTATGAGEAVITAAVNDVAASCTVKVESFIAPVYMNVELVGEFDYSVNQPEGETARVIDLTDETQARTITVKAPLYQNVNDVKTLASMQGVTWEIEGAAECVETVVNDDFTLTATFTGKPGVVSFKPVMLNGNTNVRLPIYVSNGFVTEVNIVRGDGKDWVYGEKETIRGVERDVIEIVEGSSITAVSSATNVTQTYNGWMLMRYDDEYATDQTSGSNGASFDLSKLKVGLYSLVLRVPSYEQDYNIDPLGGNPQDRINSEMIYIRVVEKNAMGDLTGDGNINASDAVLILQAVAGGAMTEAQIAAADMDGDGKVSANDAVLILQYSAN